MEKTYRDYLEYLEDSNLVVDLFIKELTKVLKKDPFINYSTLSMKVYSKIGAIEKFAGQKIDSSLRYDIEYWLKEFVKGTAMEWKVVPAIEKSLKGWFAYITPEDLCGDSIFEEEEYLESLVEKFIKKRFNDKIITNSEK